MSISHHRKSASLKKSKKSHHRKSTSLKRSKKSHHRTSLKRSHHRKSTSLKRSKKLHRKSASLKRSKKTHQHRKSKSLKRSKNNNYNWIDSSKLKKNSLSKYGYTTHGNTQQRHISLEKAVKAYGASSVWSKLNVVSILNKNRSPKTSNVFTMDKNWIKKEFM